jgi:hypothetical protein
MNRFKKKNTARKRGHVHQFLKRVNLRVIRHVAPTKPPWCLVPAHFGRKQGGKLRCCLVLFDVIPGGVPKRRPLLSS